MRPLFLAVLLLAGAGLLGAAGCAKRCESAEGCQRSCQCTDADEGTTYACPMTFNCDTENGVCDPMHGKSCDEICATYAANDACGRQCTKDGQCLLRCTCELEEGASIVCEQPFACEIDVGVCEPSHALTDCEALCQSCYIGN